MITITGLIVGAIAGGATIFLCPGLGTGGNAWFKRVRSWWNELV